MFEGQCPARGRKHAHWRVNFCLHTSLLLSALLAFQIQLPSSRIGSHRSIAFRIPRKAPRGSR
jgi:hypothetical protein